MNHHSEVTIHDTGVIDVLSIDDLPNDELPFPPEFHESARDVHVNLYSDGLPPESQYDPRAIALRKEGVSLRSDDDPRGAIELFRASIEIEPFFIQAHLNLATALFTDGQLAEAELIWRRLQTLSEAQGVTHAVKRMLSASLGYLYLELAEKELVKTRQRYYLTISDIEHRLAADFSDHEQAEVLADWAAVAVLLQDLDRAKTLWGRVIASDPKRSIIGHKLSKRPYLKSLEDTSSVRQEA